MEEIAKKIANALNIHGPFNIQFLIKDASVKVIECNIRASRSFPFVSKVLGHNLIEEAIHVMLDHEYPTLISKFRACDNADLCVAIDGRDRFQVSKDFPHWSQIF